MAQKKHVRGAGSKEQRQEGRVGSSLRSTCARPALYRQIDLGHLG